MAAKATKPVNTAANIKMQAVQGHVGASKYINDDWKTIAFSFPRNQLNQKFLDQELYYSGIYFLFGYEDGHEVVYVGQALKDRNGEGLIREIRYHHNRTADSFWSKWSWVIAITHEDGIWESNNLDALESIFIDLVPDVNNLNGRGQNNGGANLDLYEDKINQIKAYITSVGFNVFNDIAEKEEIKIHDETYNTTVVEDLHKGTSRIPEIVTPHRIVKAMVDMLPAEVWNSKTTFLDPACKGGEYLREVYDRLMDAEILQSEFPNAIERSNHILKNQIYGIALSQLSLERTTKKLLGEDRNIRIIPKYIDKLKIQSKYDIEKLRKERADIQSILNKEFGKEMKFDVVIGNPPYQESTGAGKNGGKAIYDSFILAGLSLSDRLCMVVKNNWMNSDDLKPLRDAILDNGLKTLVNYSLLRDVFPSMGIAASILYTDKQYHGNIDYTEIQKGEIKNQYCEDIRGIGFIPSSLYEYTIVRKVQALMGNDFKYHVIGTNPFGISTDGKVGKDEFIDESVIKTEYYNILLKYAKEEAYTNISCFKKNNELVDKYKIICPKQIHKTNNPIPSVMGLKPNEVCSGQYSLLYCDSDMVKATNVAKYIKTKFFRFLVNCLADSLCAFTAYRVSLVPDQDFSSNSDINWSQTLSDIDESLYKKYNLTAEEVDYIERSIKSFDVSTSKTKYTQQDAEAALINKLCSK